MTKEKRKKYWNYIWNGLFGLIILILLVPSWRIKFQSTIQRIFMSRVELKNENNELKAVQNIDWIIYDSNFEQVNFNDFNDKPIVLNFWATWCPSCVAELPSLKMFSEEIKSDGKVICITTESHETLKEWGSFETFKSLIYFAKRVPKEFDFNVYPTTFILDNSSNILSKIEGAHEYNTSKNISFIKSLSQ